uniref:Uncharacterized protein n=1 Tax=Utricularia reniformis TaxID=192314 RepID=A0A1Y0B2P6_9LAMI|nr:hypothetical protein AEK19_MT1480 [Utricularia reniformis]ART31670.1 hypothetical protein AEK19_MT1480 [Utricularia reniformis]
MTALFVPYMESGKWNLVYCKKVHAGFYMRIDRSIARFTPEIFLPIVVVSTPPYCFY